QSGLVVLLVLSVFVIYMVLRILYESFIHPLTILSALPFAGFGALLTLMLFRIELSVYAFVGIIMLVGLVKKNGIMMIDFALELQRLEGKSAREAILEACSIRFRPIMMTTMAALMGTLPIALGVGQGSEDRKSTRLNSSLLGISYAVFCLKKKIILKAVDRPVPCTYGSVGADCTRSWRIAPVSRSALALRCRQRRYRSAWSEGMPTTRGIR